MRKITTQAINAFMNDTTFRSGNTSVEKFDGDIKLVLHGNVIAIKSEDTGSIEISTAGWNSDTTKERLNGIPGVSIYQKKGVWYLNDNVWNGEWLTISK